MPERLSQISPGSTRAASAPSVSPDDRRQLADVVDALRETLGDDLLAVYLYGSAVLGGLRPESDLDLLALSRRRLDDAERPRLLARILAASGVRSVERPGRPIELSVAVHDDVRPWRHPADRDLLYGEWLRRDLEAGDLAPFRHQPSPDMTTLIAIVLMAGVPLLGPPPRDLLDPIPGADLAQAVTEGVDDLLANLEPDTRNVLLTLARVWYTVETGEIRPKDEAASWAAAQLPGEARDVLELAAAAYRGEAEDDWDARQGQAAAAAAAITARIQLTSG